MMHSHGFQNATAARPGTTAALLAFLVVACAPDADPAAEGHAVAWRLRAVIASYGDRWDASYDEKGRLETWTMTDFVAEQGSVVMSPLVFHWVDDQLRGLSRGAESPHMTIEYDGDEFPVRVSGGRFEGVLWDQFGNLAGLTDARGEPLLSMTYHPDGRLDTARLASTGATKSVAYDESGAEIRSVPVPFFLSNSGRASGTFEYENGRVVSVEPGIGLQRRFVYNDGGVISGIAADNGEVLWEYVWEEGEFNERATLWWAPGAWTYSLTPAPLLFDMKGHPDPYINREKSLGKILRLLLSQEIPLEVD